MTSSSVLSAARSSYVYPEKEVDGALGASRASGARALMSAQFACAEHVRQIGATHEGRRGRGGTRRARRGVDARQTQHPRQESTQARGPKGGDAVKNGNE